MQPKSISFSAKYPATPLPSTLTTQQIEEYKRDGFILIPGLVKGDELQNLVDEAEYIYNSWNILDFVFKASFAKISMQAWRQSSVISRFAFESALPSMSAQLMGEPESIRILKDAVFGYTKEGKGCGFHVDDRGFWPATDDTTGVNLWLALSPMRVQEGGGIRVANQSLTHKIHQGCVDVIRQGMNTTCSMHELSPECDEKLMQASVVYEMNPGDALLWDRSTFHRTEPFHVESDSHKLRYTIRYIPGHATAEGILHPSVENGQKFDSPYYPQVWPAALESEVDAIRQGLEADVQVFRFIEKVAKRKLAKLFASPSGRWMSGSKPTTESSY